MCGIAGYVLADRTRLPERRALQAMSTALAHRGPDGDGFWCTPGVGLVNRRLAIVDIAGGTLPMADADGRSAIAYNGEIYNTGALRRDLESRGHRFRTHSDTEVVLAAYQCFGDACLDRLEGQFAFAIWDAAKGALFLARDPFGICPLFYAQMSEGFVFASEIKALLTWPGIVARADPVTVAAQLVSGCFAGTRTAFEGVHALPPGRFLSADGRGTRMSRYYSLPAPPPEGVAPGTDGTEKLAESLAAATRARLPAETGWGVLLSGGIDSSAITLLAALASGPDFEAYTIDYPDPWKKQTDRDYAALVAEQAGCRHVVLTFEPDAYFDALSTVVWDVEQPFNKAASTAWLLYRAIGKRQKVVLCGDGADEIFGGYVNSVGMDFAGYAQAPESRLPWVAHGELALSLLDPDFAASVRARERHADLLADAEREARSRAPLDRYLFLYSTIFLPELLSLQDRCSYAAGIETRYPFLDRAIVEAALSRPAPHADVTKPSLRSAVSSLLPDQVLRRTKSHLPVPRSPAALRLQARLVHELLLTPASRAARYFDRAMLARLLADQAASTDREAVARWQLTMYLITLELHHRVFRV